MKKRPLTDGNKKGLNKSSDRPNVRPIKPPPPPQPVNPMLKVAATIRLIPKVFIFLMLSPIISL